MASGYRHKRIAIKIGSNVLVRRDGTIDTDRMSALVDEIAGLKKDGLEIILISSGAVAFGRNELKVQDKLDSVSQRQLFSAVGQAKLINRYYELFRKHGIVCGQVLTMKETFGTRQHYLNQKNCISTMLSHGVLPIVNENDTISVTELMFTDNDELSGLIATMMDMESLVILSNIDGIYSGHPNDPTSEVIRRVRHGADLTDYIQTGKSDFGRGGMLTKCNIARKVADEGIEVVIANGKKDQILHDVLETAKDVVCTRFEPAESISSVKKWIAHSDGFAKGEILVNEGAAAALRGDEARSLLLVGVTEIRGDFEKDDIVRILDPEGIQIGIGRTQYSSEEARPLIGQKNEKPLVHYDFLYIEQ